MVTRTGSTPQPPSQLWPLRFFRHFLTGSLLRARLLHPVPKTLHFRAIPRQATSPAGLVWQQPVRFRHIRLPNRENHLDNVLRSTPDTARAAVSNYAVDSIPTFPEDLETFVFKIARLHCALADEKEHHPR